MTDRRITVKQFPRVTPQSWKPNKAELEDYADALNDDPTVEYYIEPIPLTQEKP